MADELKPCPFCGAGTTQIKENGKIWLGMRYSEPSSVSVAHWCPPIEGQPARMIERVGRDLESAVAAWNMRALPQTHSREMPNLDGDWSPISETLVHRLRDPIPAHALSDMPERMAEAINVIHNEAADAIESLAGQFRELEYLMQCGANAKVSK